jgi:hypothetical protein
MADVWWFEPLKYLGGIALGVGGTKLTQYNKRRNMRRRLYRELTHNYLTLRIGLHIFERAESSESLALAALTLPRIRAPYYEHAKKDMDLFFDLPEAHRLDTFYANAAALTNLLDDPGDVLDDLFHEAVFMAEFIETGFASGRLDLKLAKKVMYKSQFPELATRVAAAPSREEVRTRLVGLAAEKFRRAVARVDAQERADEEQK